MDRLTLRFRDTSLEAEYQATYPTGRRRITRFGIVLTAFLFVLFGFLETPESPEIGERMWTLRLGTFAALAVIFGVSYTNFFLRHMQLLVSVGVVAIAGVYALLQAMTPRPLIQETYAFILMMMGAYTVLALQFGYALLVSSLITLVVLLDIFYLTPGMSIGEFSALVYAATAMLLVSTGAYLFDRERRRSFYMRRQLEAEREESHRLALHDSLTGLPNRRLLMEKLQHAIERAQRYQRHAALMFLDLDGFKQVNDTQGHDAGDSLLVEVARRLKSVARQVDTTARLGGDEFVLLFEDVMDRSDVTPLAERVMRVFEEPVQVSGTEIQVAASIGIAFYPGDGETADQLLIAADKAMYLAKKTRGTNFELFSAV